MCLGLCARLHIGPWSIGRHPSRARELSCGQTDTHVTHARADTHGDSHVENNTNSYWCPFLSVSISSRPVDSNEYLDGARDRRCAAVGVACCGLRIDVLLVLQHGLSAAAVWQSASVVYRSQS